MKTPTQKSGGFPVEAQSAGLQDVINLLVKTDLLCQFIALMPHEKRRVWLNRTHDIGQLPQHIDMHAISLGIPKYTL